MIFINVDVTTVDQSGRGNTRLETWTELYEGVAELPFFCKGRVGSTANLYLFAIVSAGLFGSFFFFAAIFKSLKIFFLNISIKKGFEGVALGGLLFTVLFTALLEGYLLESASISVFTFWLILSQIK